VAVNSSPTSRVRLTVETRGPFSVINHRLIEQEFREGVAIRCCTWQAHFMHVLGDNAHEGSTLPRPVESFPSIVGGTTKFENQGPRQST
jgi:hypothetical protein